MVEAPTDDAAEAFARKLNELREASGRTYGSLARRVGVGASTLHRYCSGRTVPMTFAPVERLARICGCQGEELVALHRLWVLADAARSRRQEPLPAAGTAEGDQTADTPSSPAAPADEPPAPATAPAPAPGGPASAPAPAPGAEQVPARSPAVPRRSRRTAYAAAFGASAVALVLLLGFGGFTLTGDTERTPTAAPERGRTVPSGPPPPPAATPSGSPIPNTAPSGPRSPKGDPTATPGAGGTAPDPRPTSSPRLPTGTPFTWVTDDHVWQNGCDHTYLVDRSPAEVPPPPVEADAEAWARSLRARHGGDTRVRITLQGKGTGTVVLESLHVRVVSRRTPGMHAAYRMDAGCGGSLTPRLFDVDLDKARPVPRSVAGNDAGEPLPAVSFPYRISSAEPEVLLVTGRTVACDCDWYLQLRWSSGGRSGTVRIDDGGRPFRTSGLADGPVHEYDYGSRRWVSSSPAVSEH